MMQKKIITIVNDQLEKIYPYHSEYDTLYQYEEFDSEMRPLLVKLHNNWNYVFNLINKYHDNKKYFNNITENGVVRADVSRVLKNIQKENYSIIKELGNNGLKIELDKAYEKGSQVLYNNIYTNFDIPKDYENIELKIYDPIYFKKEHSIFEKPQYLLFGISKPDVVIKKFDKLEELSGKVIFYDGDFPKGSLTNGVFKEWWTSNKIKYNVNKFSDFLTKKEKVVYNYYIENYKRDDYPMLIPQVWYYCDPVLKNKRGNDKVPFRSRLDFLLIYEGKRLIIEIDGKEHYKDSNTYIEQVKFDRYMSLQGYMVLRVANAELEDNCNNVLKELFENIYLYLNITK